MKKKIVNTLFYIGIVFYVLFLSWNILFKYVSPVEMFSSTREYYRSINIVPFIDVLNDNFNIMEIVGNIILFIPLGIYMGIFNRGKLSKNIINILVISTFFEVSQYIFALGATDVTDICTNTTGGIIGILIYFSIKKLLKYDNKVKNFVTVCSSVLLLLVSFIFVGIILAN